jgi:hypothetical protein
MILILDYRLWMVKVKRLGKHYQIFMLCVILTFAGYYDGRNICGGCSHKILRLPATGNTQDDGL